MFDRMIFELQLFVADWAWYIGTIISFTLGLVLVTCKRTSELPLSIDTIDKL